MSAAKATPQRRPAPEFVSQHALLRFCERVYKIDCERLKVDIASEIAPLVHKLGDGIYPLNKLAPGFVAVVANRTVVTVRPAR